MWQREEWWTVQKKPGSDWLNRKKTDEIEHMQEELDELKQKLEDHSRNTDLLKHLYDGGYIDMHGDPILRRFDMD